MLPIINGKSFLSCTESDLSMIIGNPDYRENEYIDYKGNFNLAGGIKDKADKNREIAEFRSDVCSFANAGGGYLVYGIHEEGGIPHTIIGIDIQNGDTDKFELSIKNWLQRIEPKIPSITISFIRLDNGKYVLVLYVMRDSFAPYMHLENEKDYRVYKRVGNSKMPIGYSELHSMFNRSMVLEKEINHFRTERVEQIRTRLMGIKNVPPRFIVMHIIPDTFMDSNYNIPLLYHERRGIQFGKVFQALGYSGGSIPMVEGMRFLEYNDVGESRMYNSGIAECYYSKMLISFTDEKGEHFAWSEVWNALQEALQQYLKIVTPLLKTNQVFIGITLVGCANAISTISYEYGYAARIDRDVLAMNTMVLESILDEEQTKRDIDGVYLDYLLSLGLKTRKHITDELIEELSHR